MVEEKKETYNHLYLNHARILNIINGVWPIKLTGKKLKYYNYYFYTSFAYFITFDMAQGVEAFFFRGSFMETADNLGVLIIYVSYIYKVLITRSETVRNMITSSEEKEKEILENADEQIKQIYLKYARVCTNVVDIYFTVGTISVSLYFIKPLVRNFMENPAKKFVTFQSWFPFDRNEHYWAAFLIQLCGGFYGYSYVVNMGTIYTSLLIFLVGQLHVMRHILKNISKYISKFSQETGLSYKEAQDYYIRICVKQHQTIIRSVAGLDKTIKTFLLLDFTISSMQLSLLTFQLIKGHSVVERCAALSFLLTLLLQLFLFYWHAHEVIIQSSGMSDSIFESDWYQLELPVQKSLGIIMIRAQKPLSLSIGPFYEAKTDAIIPIYKAIYSYLTLITRMQNEP